ncbi:MAG: hypothetical protein D3903_07405 [Candidatus Electrothrix sp. GM3_4]|nr:hypothetical protein [Candidatus Electrothrix sp. GM3_4]
MPIFLKKRFLASKSIRLSDHVKAGHKEHPQVVRVRQAGCSKNPQRRALKGTRDVATLDTYRKTANFRHDSTLRINKKSAPVYSFRSVCK